MSSNLTEGDTCQPLTFHVDGLWDAGEYAARSTSAHIVVGSLLSLGILGWMLYVFQQLRLERAFVIGGMALMLGSGYLGVWVLFLAARPSRIASGLNWSFAKRDLVQQQHLVISLLGVTAGLLEVLWGGLGRIGGGRLSFRWGNWHVAW